MAFNLTTADKILKIDYEGPVREQLNTQKVLVSKLKKNYKDFVGRQAYIPVHKGRNVGIGARAESGTLPTAGSQQYDSLIYTVKYLYGRIGLTGPAIAASKNSAGAFVRAVQSEMEGLVKDLAQDENRQLWHDGSGILTRCTSGADDTGLHVESTKFLKAGQTFQCVNGADGGANAHSSQDSDTITSIDGPQDATKGTAFSTDANDVIIADGSRAYSTTTVWKAARELWGLQAIVAAVNPGGTGQANGLDGATYADSYIGQVTRTGNPWHQANVLGNSDTLRALTLDLMQQAFDLSDIEGDTFPGLILTNHAIKRRYASLLQADKRYPAGGEITLDGGYKALEFNGVPLVADKDASLTFTPQQLNRIYFLAMSSLEYHILEDWGWMEKDGAVLSRVSNKDEYEATMYSYRQLGVNRSNANTVLTDLAES
jgi:hypothetical protein